MRAILLLCAALAACSHARVDPVQRAATGPLPPPILVAVADFAITPAQVTLDTGVGPELMRQDESPSMLQRQAAEATQAALAEALVRRLASYGLPAERLPPGMAPPAGTLLVQGQIAAVNQGNRTRRVLIGFGSGRSSVEADTQLYYVTASLAPAFLASFTGTANSGRMPGAAGTMGAGAVAQRLATSAAVAGAAHGMAESRRAGDTAIATDLAHALARQVGAYAASRGWIAAGAVR
jgi:hypothetical protein